MKPSVLLTLRRGIESIAQTLLEQADVELIVMYDDMEATLTDLGVPCRRLLSFLSDTEMALAQFEGRRRFLAVEQFLTSPFFSQRCAGMGFDASVMEILRAKMLATLPEDLFQEVVYLDCLRRCASQCDLRLVLVHQDVARDTRTLVNGAQRLGIPSLHILHGYPYGTVNLHDTLRANAVAVYSDASRAIYRSFGVPDERIFVTGNPEWDMHVCPPRAGRRGYVCGALELDMERPIITYAMTFMHRLSAASIRNAACRDRTTDAVLAAFGKLAQRHPDWQFVLRPHPNEEHAEENLRERAQRAGILRPIIDTTTSSSACATTADVMVCVQSNMGIEAIIAGRPVVNVMIDAFGHDAFEDGLGPLFIDDDAAVTVREVEEIAPAVEAALLDPSAQARFRERRPATVRRFNHFTDGKSTERVCRVALDMVADGRRYLRPVERFPETERALAESIPANPKRVLVFGRGAAHVADMVVGVRGDVVPTVCAEPTCPEGPWDAIVLAAPLPHSGDADSLLIDCMRVLVQEGSLVLAFMHSGTLDAIEAHRAQQWAPPRSGADDACLVNGYSLLGIEVLLARCGLELADCVHVPTAALSPAFNAHLGQPDDIGSASYPLYGASYSIVTARRTSSFLL